LQYLEDGVTQNRELRNNTGQTSFSQNLDATKINRKPLLRSKGVSANHLTEEEKNIDINRFAEKTRTWISSGNLQQGKLNIQKLLEDKDYKFELLLPHNDLTRHQLIELVGDSYDKMGTQFSYELLHQISDFDILKNFIEVYDVERNYSNVFLGKAYLHLPNKLEKKLSLKERKKMQMIALKYYLQAAKEGNFIGQKSSSIKAINELAKAYRIFKYNPKKSKKFISIETLIKRKNKVEIQNRIDYVDRIIRRLS